jgi:glycosyltransferase involved in cell wall biosynthesis
MSASATIIVPTRNRASVLARCLAALPAGAAGIESPEVIVVDDGSSDSTRHVVEEFCRSSGWGIQYVRQERPQGANAARNKGLSMARGEIIVMIDDDTIAADGWLKKLLSGLSPEFPVVSGSARVTLEGPILGRHREEVSTYLSEVLAPAVGLNGVTVPVGCNMAAFRWVFQATRFDETVSPPSEEGDWLQRAGVRTRFVPEALVWHYKTPEEACLNRLLRLAWSRGRESGWWIRERGKIRSTESWPMAANSLNTSFRAFGHAIARLCWGGVVIGVSELSKALALGGIINRGPRVPENWR